MARLEASVLGMFCDGRGISPVSLNHTHHLFPLALFVPCFGYLSGHFQGPGILLGIGKTKEKMDRALSLPLGKAEKGIEDYNFDDQCYNPG